MAEEPDPLGPARGLLTTALLLSERAADAGDPVGSYELCACAGRLARKVRGLGEIADFRLERALDDADLESDPARQAENLREAFDSLLGDTEAEGEGTEDDDLPEEPLARAQSLIERAISIGAPAYNTGDHQGCYDVYACTGRMIVATVTGADAALAKLREGLEKASGLDDPDEQAWAMRHAFDAVVEMGGVSGVSAREVKLYISIAIQLGAPAYNLGDHRGCFEVYSCTARFLANTAAVPDVIKDRLRSGLAQASAIPDVGKQAWVLRQIFDAILMAGVAAEEGEGK